MASVRDFSVSAFFTGFGSFSFMLLLPIRVEQLGFDRIAIGMVLSSYAVAVLLFSPLWGYFSDRSGRRKPFLILGYLIFSGGSLLLITAQTIPELMAFRFLQGVGFAAHPMLVALFTDHFGSEATRRFGTLSGLEALGWGIGSLTAGFLADQLSIQVAFATAAMWPLVSAALVYGRLPESRPETRQTSPTPTGAAPPEAFPKKLFFLYGTVFVRMSSAIALWSMLPLYLMMFVENLTQAGAVNAVNMLMQPLFMIWLGKYAEPLGRLRLVMWGIFGTVLTFWLYASAAQVWQILLGQITISLSWAAIVIGMNTYVMATASKHVRGKAFGYLTSSIMIAMAVGPMLGSTLAAALSIRGMIFIVSLLMLPSLPLLIRLRMLDQRAGVAAEVTPE